MTEPIKPALSSEEWTDLLPVIGEVGKGIVRNEDRHFTAAVCLYGQPFGFTREDLKAINEGVGGIFGRCAEFCVGGCSCGDDARRLENLADRIRALLPPEGDSA